MPDVVFSNFPSFLKIFRSRPTRAAIFFFRAHMACMIVSFFQAKFSLSTKSFLLCLLFCLAQTFCETSLTSTRAEAYVILVLLLWRSYYSQSERWEPSTGTDKQATRNSKSRLNRGRSSLASLMRLNLVRLLSLHV